MSLPTTPRLWPYEPLNSPLPLPQQPVIFSEDELFWIEAEPIESESMSVDELKNTVSDWKSASGDSIDSILSKLGAPLMQERRPILLVGELANPSRLYDIGAGPMPIINVRIDDVCRTWNDTMDARMVQPGVHHITLARTQGWWESTHLGFATLPQIRQLIEYLGDGSRIKWKPAKLAEGSLHVLHNTTIEAPTMDDILWDGTVELVERERPAFDGPQLPFEEVFTPIHTLAGCYNHRGRFARCIHYLQRSFHDNIYRRGSARVWSDVISVIKK